ncbi:hypothetical protein AB835_05745 [Candidatus Endobugula sertula]|uniref:Uncharacterized protein n=1 Tax=Candidatus Endobugula sertula TaxID=62101 RepID=A0A1D2QR02_9GAMM|nr:hypothetical protein AB835_05745 [Candidatus Endobugula sertula]
MPSIVVFFLIVMTSFMIGCSGGVATDNELAAPQDRIAPGVFTGSSGEFSVTKYFSDEAKRKKSGGYYILDLKGAPPMSEEEFKEFESFRAWLRSKEKESSEYKEYQQWRATQQSSPSS